MPLLESLSQIAGRLPHKAGARERAVVFFREATEKFDADHVAYLIRRGIRPWDLLPNRFIIQGAAWAVRYADLLEVLTDEDFVEVAQRSRPDLNGLLTSEEGLRWLRGLLSWRNV